MLDSPPRLVVVCTANLGRSPMGEALLASALGDAAAVSSAGVEAASGRAPMAEAVRAMAARSVDISGHRSRPLDASVMASADLVLTMTRAHVRQVAVMHASSFGRTFTFREIVRRATPLGPRARTTTLAAWLAEVGRDRRAADVVGDDPDDDIADPYRHPYAAYERAAAELAASVDAFVRLAFPWVAGAISPSPG